jgi:hypothetical protein
MQDPDLPQLLLHIQFPIGILKVVLVWIIIDYLSIEF